MRRGRFLALLVLSFTLVSCGAFSEAAPRELFSSRVAVDEKGAEYVEGEVLVQLSHGASTMSAQGFAASRGMTAARRFEALSSAKGKDVMHLRSDSKSTARMIQELSADPRVEIVEPNYIRRASETLPNASAISSTLMHCRAAFVAAFFVTVFSFISSLPTQVYIIFSC